MVLGLLVHVTPSNFFRRILRSKALVYKSYFFRTAVIRTLFDIRFSYNHCNFSCACLLLKMASKTVTRSILIYGELSLLPRRFVFPTVSHRGECETRVTGDEAQGTSGLLLYQVTIGNKRRRIFEQASRAKCIAACV